MSSSFVTRGSAAATLCALFVTLAPLPMVAATGVFSDVSGSTRYSTAINALAAEGVVQGYANKTFRPNNTINRAEFLKIVLEGRTGGESFAGSNCFPDVHDEWFAKYVCTAEDEGIVAGYPNGYFRPEQPVTFVEAAKIMTLAFRQQPASHTNFWYESYARALESSKAIPPTIEKLDAPLTRGEMAEMIWRLTEAKTGEEAIGYLNVKYPDTAVNFASDEPQRAKSCTDLRAFSEEASTQSMNMYYRDAVQMGTMEDAAAAPSAENKTALPQTGGSTGGGGDYSQTNVQVQGVDEGDIVKSDGEYLYIVRNYDKQSVRIVKATPATAMKEVSIIDLTKDGMSPQDLYIDGDTLVVIGNTWQNYPMPMMEKRMAPMIYPPMWNTSRTEVRLYNVANAASPKLVRTVSFEGNSVSTRRIDDKVYLVLSQPMYWRGPVHIMDDVIPMYRDSAEGNLDKAVVGCDDVMILPRVPNPQYMTVAVIPTDDADGEIHKEVVLGNAQNIYMSTDNLYVATTEWNYIWDSANPQSNEKTNVYRFNVTDTGVSLASKGSVPGHILNQFSMDEYENSFRIATTTSPQWNAMGETMTKERNALYVLNMNMEQIGDIEDIAPGETIYSVRFMGDRTYMVTFKKIDPFFVLDTSDPRNPSILGKLKIPGYSDYLHPYDATHIIGFGKEAVESKQGDFAWYQGMKVAIFDVTDVEDPKEMHKITIGDRGTESPLLHNHKALLFEKDRDLLAFPVTVAKITDAQKQSAYEEGSAYGSPTFQGAQVYDISLKDGFKLRGAITHYDADTFEKAGDYWYGGGRDIERITRIGTSLYSISPYGVSAHTEETVKSEGMLKFAE